MVSSAPSAEKFANRFSRLVISNPTVRSECIRTEAYHRFERWMPQSERQ